MDGGGGGGGGRAEAFSLVTQKGRLINIGKQHQYYCSYHQISIFMSRIYQGNQHDLITGKLNNNNN